MSASSQVPLGRMPEPKLEALPVDRLAFSADSTDHSWLMLCSLFLKPSLDSGFWYASFLSQSFSVQITE